MRELWTEQLWPRVDKIVCPELQGLMSQCFRPTEVVACPQPPKTGRLCPLDPLERQGVTSCGQNPAPYGGVRTWDKTPHGPYPTMPGGLTRASRSVWPERKES